MSTTATSVLMSALAMEQIGFVILTLLFPPLLLLIVLILLLAITGKSLGIRKFYVKMLLRIFEVFYSRVMSVSFAFMFFPFQWGKQCIRQHQKEQRLSRHGSNSSSLTTEDSGINSSGDEEEEVSTSTPVSSPLFSTPILEDIGEEHHQLSETTKVRHSSGSSTFPVR